MARENIYLGKTVKDMGKPGLDNLKEVEGIADAILDDYKRHRIPYRTAMSRLNFLTLVVHRDSDFKGRKLKRAVSIIEKRRRELKELAKKT